jgi:hypothetical protein
MALIYILTQKNRSRETLQCNHRRGVKLCDDKRVYYCQYATLIGYLQVICKFLRILHLRPWQRPHPRPTSKRRMSYTTIISPFVRLSSGLSLFHAVYHLPQSKDGDPHQYRSLPVYWIGLKLVYKAWYMGVSYYPCRRFHM